jgi:hypothetical protein
MPFDHAPFNRPRPGRNHLRRLHYWGLLCALSAVGLLVIWGGVAPSDAQAPDTFTPNVTFSPTPPFAEAIVVVERATVFLVPQRTGEPLTYLYERERVPILGRTPDGVYLFVAVEHIQGWILAAQVDVEGDLDRVALIEPVPDEPPTPVTPTRTQAIPSGPPTRTPLPTQTVSPIETPVPTIVATDDTDQPPAATPTPSADTLVAPPDESDLMAGIFPGEPPPLHITLPEGWKELHVIAPFRTLSTETREMPLSIYFGLLPDGAIGYIYLFWGFPNIVGLDGEYNLWADGLQILRGTLIGESCNLGLDLNPKKFVVGGLDAVGTFYTAVSCADQEDTTGWFAVLRMYQGNYAFFTAVEPIDALRPNAEFIQDILDSVEFIPPEE